MNNITLALAQRQLSHLAMAWQPTTNIFEPCVVDRHNFLARTSISAVRSVRSNLHSSRIISFVCLLDHLAYNAFGRHAGVEGGIVK